MIAGTFSFYVATTSTLYLMFFKVFVYLYIQCSLGKREQPAAVVWKADCRGAYSIRPQKQTDEIGVSAGLMSTDKGRIPVRRTEEEMGGRRVFPSLAQKWSQADPISIETQLKSGPQTQGLKSNTTIFNIEEEEDYTSRPHQDSCFVPGKIGGRNLQCLLDSGCTTNILSKHVFDRLPSRLRDQLEARQIHGAMADGTQMALYGIIRLELRLSGLKIEEVFVVGQINEDVILGMPFLVERQCTMNFGIPVVSIEGKELRCTYRHGR